MSLDSIEILAVFFNVAYVILAWYQRKICWLFGALGSVLSVYYFQHPDIRLYSEAGLYGFYVLMAAYGWWAWSKEDGLAVSEYKISTHAYLVVAGLIAAWVLSFLTGKFTDAARPLADSLSTSFSVIATVLTIKKILSNWLYWILIDLFSICLYFERGANIYALQMLLFGALAIYGYYQWRQAYKTNLCA